MVAINVLWKVLVGFGVAGLGLASVLYGGQLKLDNDKLDESVFVQYREDNTRQTAVYRKENNEFLDKIEGAVNKMQGDVIKIKTILERMEQ